MAEERNAYWALYLGLNKEDTGIDISKYFKSSKYKPTKRTSNNPIYSLHNDSTILSDDTLLSLLEYKDRTGKNSRPGLVPYSHLGTYTISLGEDKNGKYISYYDDWDINPFRGRSKFIDIHFLDNIDDIIPFSKPFSLYNRRYYTEEEINKLKTKR